MDRIAKIIGETCSNRLIARMIVLGVLLSLPGCSIPSLRQAQPSPNLPDSFQGRTSSKSSAELTVDEFYQDPVLTQMVEEALAGNQQLKLLEEDIQIARNEIRARRGVFLPFAFLRANAGLDRPSLFTPIGAAEDQLTAPGGRSFNDPLGNFMVGADIFWRIDIWRQYRNARDAAVQRYGAAIEKRDSFVTELVAEIAANYYELMALDQRIENLNRIIGLQQQSLEFAQARKAGGRSNELAVQRFQAEVRRNQSQNQINLQQITITENRINFSLGRFPQPVGRESTKFLDLNLRDPSVGLPSQLLLNRPDIRQAERELAASGLDVLSARARFFPSVNLTANIGYEAFDTRFLFRPEAIVGQVAGGLVQPLINKLAIQADYLSANARQLQALYNYQRTVLNGFTEVTNGLAQAERFGQAVDLKREQLAALESAVDAATSLFQAARANYLDVLFAQDGLRQARRELIETKQEQLVAIVNVYRALGGGVVPSTSSVNLDEFEIPPMPEIPTDPKQPAQPAVPPPPALPEKE